MRSYKIRFTTNQKLILLTGFFGVLYILSIMLIINDWMKINSIKDNFVVMHDIKNTSCSKVENFIVVPHLQCTGRYKNKNINFWCTDKICLIE